MKDYLKEVNGTSLQGYVDVSYEELVRIFGKPNAKGDCYKIDAEWEIQTPFGVATIYNYKDGKNYMGDEGVEVEEITEWHIGGHNKETAGYIVEKII